MADTITITPKGGSAVTLTPIPGSVKGGGGHDDRGGGRIPKARAGYARNGSCDVVLDDASATAAAVMGLASGEGAGDREVVGAGRYGMIKSYQALVDVELSGDSVQTATISWKGSYNAEAGEG
jgi:hypothetical protein